MQDYKRLKVWTKSHQFTLRIYELTRFFPREEIYGLTNQLRRSAASVSANIAEGCGRNTSGALAQHLHIALGSANEAEYFLILSHDLNYFDENLFEVLFDLINQVKAMLISLIDKVKN